MLLALSLVYLVAEIEFNMSLLDIAGSVRSDPAEIDELQVFGRAVSACGCFLLVLGLFARRGFHVTGARLKAAYGLVAAVSLLPLLLILLQALVGSRYEGWLVPIRPDAGDMWLAIAPLLGFAYGMLMGRHKNAFVTIASLFMMVWPGIFLGQKLLIEQALIERTTWEQRVNARYVLMLRAVLEDCTINLNDLALCDAEKEQDSVKSARIILGSMWMLSPEGIRRDMEESRERMVQSVAARGLWFPPREMYKEYAQKVEAERNKFEAEFMRTVYEPYKKASDMHAAAIDPNILRRESDKAADEIERELDKGWRQYRSAVREYRQKLSTNAAMIAQKLAPYKNKLKEFCRGRNCTKIDVPDEMVVRAVNEAEREFAQRTGGYSPNITTRQGFVDAYPTQVKLREHIEKHIHDKLNAPFFMLPANWRYDRASFQMAVENLMMQEINRQWRGKFGDALPPGLPFDAFLTASGLPPLPPLRDLLMSPDQFFKTMILPRYREMLDRIIGDIESEKELYANGAALAEQGKDYARAVYIPAISLIISLVVVILTLLRWWVVLSRRLIAAALRRRALQAALRPVLQGAAIGLFAAGIFVIPYFMPNPYAGAGYQRYRAEARAQAPVAALVLDWAIHTQPFVYRLGAPVRLVLDRMHEKGA